MRVGALSGPAYPCIASVFQGECAATVLRTWDEQGSGPNIAQLHCIDGRIASHDRRGSENASKEHTNACE